MVLSFDEVIHLAEQLSLEEQNLLIYKLHQKQSKQIHQELSREALIDELNILRSSGAFDTIQTLYGKYANPNIPEISEEDFHAQMHAIATEWEQELDNFDPTNTP
ncbi:MAG: hypothetical protein SFZ02_07320 [bacterium]|nr:hypothetical protein [bacterium]